jgi:hypothetical protein
MRKEKKEKKQRKKLKQVIESRNKGKEHDHLKEESLSPLRQGQRLDTTETKQANHKRANYQRNQGKTHTRAPPAHVQLPQAKAHSPGLVHA